METRIAKSGRVVVELDGYSDGYGAYVESAVMGIISLPAKYADRDEDELADIAKDILTNNDPCSDPKTAYGAKIIRRADRVR